MPAILLTEDPLPMWVTVFERIGPGSCILLFTGAVLWKLIPAITVLLKAWRKQSDTVTAAVPTVVSSVGRIADNLERGFEALNDLVYLRPFGARGAPVRGDGDDTAGDGGAGGKDLSRSVVR